MFYAILENNEIIGFNTIKNNETDIEITKEQHSEFLNKINNEQMRVFYNNGSFTYQAQEQVVIKPSYETLVESKIREKYSISEELAILRQRDTKQDEFNEYFDYCEECKRLAKLETQGE